MKKVGEYVKLISNDSSHFVKLTEDQLLNNNITGKILNMPLKTLHWMMHINTSCFKIYELTKEEILWFDHCISIDKYISLEEFNYINSIISIKTHEGFIDPEIFPFKSGDYINLKFGSNYQHNYLLKINKLDEIKNRLECNGISENEARYNNNFYFGFTTDYKINLISNSNEIDRLEYCINNKKYISQIKYNQKNRMINNQFKFNIGDEVNIINSGLIYGTYSRIFKKLGFANTETNYYSHATHNKTWKIFGRMINSDVTLYGIQFENKQILISEEGLRSISLEKEYPFKIGEKVRLIDTGSTTGEFKKGARKNDIVIITNIVFHGGNANENDPRYLGDNFNVRGYGLEKYIEVKNEKELLFEEAKLKYPIGTKFKVVHKPNTICTVKSHEKHDRLFINGSVNLLVNENCYPATNSASVYYDGKWAEIVKDETSSAIDRLYNTDWHLKKLKMLAITNKFKKENEEIRQHITNSWVHPSIGIAIGNNNTIKSNYSFGIDFHKKEKRKSPFDIINIPNKPVEIFIKRKKD